MPNNNSYTITIFISISFLILLAVTACNPGLVNLGEQIRDDDGDGWFTNETNQLVILRLESGVFNIAGQYRIVIDDIRFPLTPSLNGIIDVQDFSAGNVIPIGIDILQRTIGTNLLDHENHVVAFTVPLRIDRLIGGLVIETFSSEINFNNQDSTFPVLMGLNSLNFTTALTKFADPNPNNANADTDGDGITELQEALLSESFNGIGDPRSEQLDILLIFGATHQSSKLLQKSKELLKSRFAFRNINLHIDDGELNGAVGEGGLVTLAGEPVPDGTFLPLATARTIRDQNVPIGIRTMSYFFLLAKDMPLLNGIKAFGIAESPSPGIRGNVAIGYSKLVDLLPDIKNYQAINIMHEFGHNLGLCHPLSSTAACVSGAIPMIERDPGATAMGTPAEDPPIVFIQGVPGAPNPNQFINALSRPLDYTPGQWTNLMIGARLGQ